MIHTVLGPIPADELGRTSMHEHLLCDARILCAPAREPPPETQSVSLETLGFVRWNLLALADNLILDDPELATRELLTAAELGQRAVVDLTSWGLRPSPQRLPGIARATGLHIVAGCGAYLDRPHPAEVAGLSTDEIARRFRVALDGQLDGAGFRAGLLGLIGTSEPMTPSERRVLAAAGQAAGQTGAAVVVRLDPAARRGLDVLSALAENDCPATQTIFANVDEFLDLGYLHELAAAGATLEWCFGNEAYYRDGYKDPTDADRLTALIRLLDESEDLVRHIVLGCSVWTKSQLRAFGGMGYDHLLRRIVPELLRSGVPAGAVEAMLVSNPAALLDR